MGSPPSALGLLGPAVHGWARRAVTTVKWLLGAQRWPEPFRASAAVLLAAGNGAWAALLHPSLAGPLAALAGCGVLAVAGGALTRNFVPVAVGVGLLGAEYLAGQAGRPVSVAGASAFGVLLLVACELTWWSAELSARSSWSKKVRRERWVWLAGTAGGAFAAGVVVGLAGISGVGPGTTVAAAGAASLLVVALALASWAREVSGRSAVDEKAPRR